MPRTIGHGRRKRAASISARSCVLSPISASATTPVDTRKACTERHRGRAADETWHDSLRPARVQETHAKGLAKPSGRLRHGPGVRTAKHVDANPARSGRLLPSDAAVLSEATAQSTDFGQFRPRRLPENRIPGESRGPFFSFEQNSPTMSVLLARPRPITAAAAASGCGRAGRGSCNAASDCRRASSARA